MQVTELSRTIIGNRKHLVVNFTWETNETLTNGTFSGIRATGGSGTDVYYQGEDLDRALALDHVYSIQMLDNNYRPSGGNNHLWTWRYVNTSGTDRRLSLYDASNGNNAVSTAMPDYSVTAVVIGI